MSSILRRLLSHNTRKFCTAASAAVNRELLEPALPWLMLPPSFTEGCDDMVYNLYSPITGNTVSFSNRGGKEETDLMRDDATSFVGSSHGWLALYNSRTCDLFLSNPLSGRRIDLPRFSVEPSFNDIRDKPSKVIISSSPNEEQCRAVMIAGDRAAICRPGRGRGRGRSREWRRLGRWEAERKGDEFAISYYYLRLFADFVYSAAQKKLFGLAYPCVLEDRLELEGWDISRPVRPEKVRLDRFVVYEKGKHGLYRPDLYRLYDGPCSRSDVSRLNATCIVSGEQPDQLFLVELYNLHRETVGAEVHRIKEGELEPCSSLDDLVMFVGINHSLAVQASKFPQLKPNSIYFSRGPYIGVFDYQNKTCAPIYYPSFCRQHLSEYEPTDHLWFTPTLE